MDYTAFKERFNIELNTQQVEAVQAVEGSVLLLAVPGSGKTTVLVDRLGYMIFGCGIAPENILTITYTDAATKDMKQRFIDKFGIDYGNRIEFRTINGISQKILMHYGRLIGKAPYDVIEKKVQASLFKNIYKHVTGRFSTEGDIKNIETGINYVKNMRLNNQQISELKIDVDKFPDIYKLYQSELKKMNRIDYDDQMVYALMLLEKVPDLLNYFRSLYRYICVDEAQDTSKLQHDVFCKPFLHKIAKSFCRLLHLHFVGNCKTTAGSYSASHKPLQIIFSCYNTRYGNGSSEFSSSCACSLK